MGGNQIFILTLTRIDLYELLQSISGKLIIERIHSEIMEIFKHKFYKTMLHVFTQIDE